MSEKSRDTSELEMIDMMTKFSAAEVTLVRQQLLERIPDPLEIAEILQAFLTGHGYGVSTTTVLDAARKVGASGCAFAALQAELEAVALVM
jgi:hypothetical protein